MLQQGATSRVLLSIQSGQIWGEDVPPMARRFLQLRFGAAVSDRIDFCETGPEVNSTADEARVLAKCISDHGWHSVVVVTSDYHTRRAGMTWKRVLREKRFALDIAIDGVADPEYSPSGWWRERTYAKTWLLEFTKLCWTTFVPWGS